jgi:hypothetical protein
LSSEESECGLADLLSRAALELRVDMNTGSSEVVGSGFDFEIILLFLDTFSYDFYCDFSLDFY